jgi:5'-methylthioadenosine phosphorylase
MTAAPEAFLAREAEMCYAALAHVTDYDVWHVSEEPVTAEMVFQIVEGNMARAQEVIRALARHKLPERTCTCKDALASALSTAPQAMDPAARERLSLLVNRYLSG